MWVIGHREVKGGVITAPDYPCNLSRYYSDLIMQSQFIARPKNPLFEALHNEQNRVLTKHASKLKSNPPPFERCCFRHEGGYPLRWSELMGEVWCQEGIKYRNHIGHFP